MSLGGKIPPPDVVVSWPKPNYIDPVSQAKIVTHLNIACVALGITIVAARLFARFILTKAAGLDDAMITIALIFALAYSSLMLVAGYHDGVGLHIWDLPSTKVAPLRLDLFAAQWCYTISLTATKISILLLYKRLSCAFTKTFLHACYVGIAYNALYGASYCVMLLNECRPINAYWLSFDPVWRSQHENDYRCSTMERTGLPVYAAFSVVGDVYSTVLPMILVSTLHLPPRRKQSLYALFALGFIVVVAGLLRTWYLYVVANATYDTSWKLANALFWITIELYLSLMCACAPALKPLAKKLFVEPVHQQYIRRHSNSNSNSNNRRRASTAYRLSERKDRITSDDVAARPLDEWTAKVQPEPTNTLRWPLGHQRQGCARDDDDEFEEKKEKQEMKSKVYEIVDTPYDDDNDHVRDPQDSPMVASSPSFIASPRMAGRVVYPTRCENEDVEMKTFEEKEGLPGSYLWL